MSKSLASECETGFLRQFLESENPISVSEEVIFLGEPVPQIIYKSGTSAIVEVV